MITFREVGPNEAFSLDGLEPVIISPRSIPSETCVSMPTATAVRYPWCVVAEDPKPKKPIPQYGPWRTPRDLAIQKKRDRARTRRKDAKRSK